MPLLTRRRAKRREAQVCRVGAFPCRMEIPNLIEGLSPVAPSARFMVRHPEYADATLKCRACGDRFEWSAEAQHLRYEVHHRSDHSFPPYCPDCSRAWHRKRALLSEYDAKVGAASDGRDLDAKRRVLALLGELDSVGHELTGRMIYTQKVFTLQLAAASRHDEDSEGLHSSTRNHRPLGR